MKPSDPVRFSATVNVDGATARVASACVACVRLCATLALNGHNPPTVRARTSGARCELCGGIAPPARVIAATRDAAYHATYTATLAAPTATHRCRGQCDAMHHAPPFHTPMPDGD